MRAFRWLSAAALAVALMSPVSAAAKAEKAPKEDPHFTAAGKLRTKKAYAKALAELKKAQKKAHGSSEEARIAIAEGVILFDMGKTNDANTALRKGLSLDANVKLGWKVSGKLHKHVEELKAESSRAAEVPLAALVAPDASKPSEPAKAPEPAVTLDPTPPPAAATDMPTKANAGSPEPTKLEPEPTHLAAAEPAANDEPMSLVRHEPAKKHRSGWWIPAVGGLVAGGVGGYFALQAKTQDDYLTGRAGPTTITQAQAASYRDTGKTDQIVGATLIGVGSAALIAGVVLFLWPPHADAPVTYGANP